MKEDELKEFLGYVPKVFPMIKDQDPRLFEILKDLDKEIWDDGVLSKKVKKLIGVAVLASQRQEEGIKAQIKGALNLGLSKEEIYEALKVVLITSGMPGFALGNRILKEITEKS